MPRTTDIRHRRGTAASWSASNPVLSAGESGWESDTNLMKIGDGVQTWNQLQYFSGGRPFIHTSHFVAPRFGRFWYTALANKTKPAIGVVGDSITQKFNAGSIANSYAGRLRSALQTNYGNGGTGFFGVAESPLVPSTLGSSYPVADRAVTTGTWNMSTSSAFSFGGPGFTMIASTVVGSTIEWTQVSGTKIDAYILGLVAASGGTYKVSIDGVDTGGTFTTYSKGADAPYRQAVTSTASTGLHTIKVTLLSGGLNLFGISGENASGVVLNRWGRSGMKHSDTVLGQNYGANWNGGSSYPVDLIILALGVNDISGNDASASGVGDSARKMLETIRNSVDCDILMLSHHVGNFDTNFSYHDAVSRYRELAIAYDAAHVNMWARYDNTHRNANLVNYWGNTATIGITGTDDVHPSDTGHQLIFNELNPIVNP